MEREERGRQEVGIDPELIERICRQLAAGRGVRRRLHPDGRIALDRPLPFLFVYRTPAGRADAGTAALIRGEASFLVAPIGAAADALVAAVGGTLAPVFGALLLVEIWSGAAPSRSPDEAPPGPAFRVVAPPDFANRSCVGRLTRSLAQVTLFRQKAAVSLETAGEVAPPGLPPLLPAGRAAKIGARLIGIEIRPVYRDPDGRVYPLARRNLQRQLARALRRTAYEFARRETTHRPRHFESLGRRAFTKIVWESDAAIAAISRSFDLLLVVTPVNAAQAFAEFERSGFEREPGFLYRPRTIDPPLLKRELYGVPIERIADPTLAFLFEEKRRELDLKLTLIEERLSRRFLPTGLALYGTVDAPLVGEARALLERFPPNPPAEAAEVGAAEFAARATALLERLRRTAPGLSSRVELRDDVSSLTVSNGNLLVGRALSFPAHRVEALLQHEVGTHVVTHWNGSTQPFQLLSAGLAGYDELQEGLAVFAEYLVGGLGPGRLRTLAARVVAAHLLVEGATFVETFRELTGRHGFGPRAAFTDSMRVHRGGGFVKDAVYLRGLRAILEFVRSGGRLRTLYLGKVATDHVPMLEELQHREVLKPLALVPPYLEGPGVRARLERVRAGLTVHELVE
jgi:uncharacterized protein (TIGR02421 family)